MTSNEVNKIVFMITLLYPNLVYKPG